MEEILNNLPEPMQINDTTLIIAGIFLVLILVLNSLIFKPLVGILEERRNRIDEGSEAQRKSMKTVEESMAAYQEALTDARRKAQSRRQEILKESEMNRHELTGAAREKALAMVQAAATDLEQQVTQAKLELKEETQEIAKRIVASVLARATS